MGGQRGQNGAVAGQNVADLALARQVKPTQPVQVARLRAQKRIKPRLAGGDHHGLVEQLV